eukprot:NODE_3598_length_948_cov_29.527253_g3307_i0.p1 GENE.NODE_3598_length_948_cov_29.527253_g3307_i0~~NODE_3598_length_948_cov_29.527253_g3307_i0.p1  ORF type:complete len:284 (+),score=39.20 NODE_3598_length_948_cov_29.527253_g3307_i0:79-930(+)
MNKLASLKKKVRGKHYAEGVRRDRNGSLRVVVKHAVNLKKTDVVGGCDPYVTLVLDKEKFRTEVHYSNLNPVFEETFYFHPPVFFENGNWISHDELKIEAFDADEIGSDDTVGKGTIAFEDLPFGRAVRRVVDLLDDGELYLEVEAEDFGIRPEGYERKKDAAPEIAKTKDSRFFSDLNASTEPPPVSLPPSAMFPGTCADSDTASLPGPARIDLESFAPSAESVAPSAHGKHQVQDVILVLQRQLAEAREANLRVKRQKDKEIASLKESIAQVAQAVEIHSV